MSKNQFHTETKEKSQEPKQDIVSKDTPEAGATPQSPRDDANDAIRPQPIRLAKVVSARFARRD